MSEHQANQPKPKNHNTPQQPAQSENAFGTAPENEQRESPWEDSGLALVSPGLVLRLQRAVGNAAAQRVIQKQPDSAGLPSIPALTRAGEVVQRAVMSSSAWQKTSSKLMRARSPLLIQIDIALAAYHKSHLKSPEDQLNTLQAVKDAIDAWKKSKRQPTEEVDEDLGLTQDPIPAPVIKSARLKAITKLEQQVDLEIGKLMAKVGTKPDITKAAGIIEASKRLYRRYEPLVRAALATVATTKAHDLSVDLVKVSREAHALNEAADALDIYNNDLDSNAWTVSFIVWRAIQLLRQIARMHLHRGTADNEELQRRRSRIEYLRGMILDTQTELVKATGWFYDAEFLANVVSDINQYGTFAAKIAPDKPGDFDFSVIGQLLDMLGISTAMLGYQGTGGKGNEGFEEFFKSGTDSDKTKVRKAFSKWMPKDSEDADKLSGGSDMANALGGAGGQAIEVWRLIKVIKDPDTDPEDRRWAVAELAFKHPLSAVSNILKFTGGALTFHRGMGNTLKESSFGFEHKGSSGTVDVDVSTDVKMAGDFAGLFAGIFESLQKVVDLVKFIKKGGQTSAKTKRRSDRSKTTETRKDLEAVGDLLSKYTGTVSSLANNTKSVIQLGYQIAGSGQVTSTVAGGVTGVANLGGVVPALGLIKGVLEAIRYGYRLARITLRRYRLGDQMENLQDAAEFGEIDAMEFVREVLMKRIVRLGIKLGHAVANIIAGGFNLSGLGSAPGMAISLASSALQFGQIGLRKTKQFARDRKAKSRLKEGKSESFADWKNRKRLESAKTGEKTRMFWTWMDIQITRNWDKSTVSKEERYREVAMQVLNMNDKTLEKALGVWEALQDEKDYQKRLEIVLSALKKRD